MNYEVSLNKLKKIVDPFNTSENENPQVNKKQIKELLDNTDIFINLDDNNHTKFLKSLAYEVANYQPQEITISLSEDGQFNRVEDIITNGLINLYAAIYLGKDTCIANITGNEKVVKTLLGVNLSKPDNIEVPLATQIKPFLWEINEVVVENTWGDIDFILKKFEYVFGDDFNEAFPEVLKHADPQVWDNYEFVMELASNYKDYFPSSIPENFLEKDSIFQVIKSRPDFFKDYWGHHLEDLFTKFEPIIDEDGKLESSYYYGQYKEAPSFLNRVKEELFTDVNYVKQILDDFKGSRGGSSSKLYKRLPFEVQFDKDIINMIYQSQKLRYDDAIWIYPHYNIPESKKNDYEWVKNFILEHGEHLSWDRIEIPNKNYEPSHGLQNLYGSWINNKELVIDMMGSVDPQKIPAFNHIYNVLPTKIKNDKEIVSIFMEKYPQSYSLLNDKYQAQYVLNHIEKSSKINLSNELIITFEDKEILKKIIEKGSVTWLATKGCPAKWKNDIELISAISFNTPDNDLKYLLDDKKIVATILKIPELTDRVLEIVPTIYSWLPLDRRLDKEIALTVMRNNEAITVETALFANKEFCIEALQANYKTRQIPDGFWNDQDFVLKVFKHVDERNISDNLIGLLPDRVQKLLTVFEVEKDYEKFFTRCFLNVNLHNNLETKSDTVKKKKI